MAWSFKTDPDRVVAIDDTGASITRQQVGGLADAVRAVVAGRQLVFCLCSNTLGSLAGYAAFVESRIVPVLLSSGLDQALLRRLAELYRPSLVWAPEAMVAPLAEAALVVGTPLVSQHGYALLRTRHESAPLHDDLAALLSTSGSTGSPHFVRLSYENLAANAASIVEYLEIGADDRPITTLPMEYSYGLSIINSHFRAGATLLVTSKSLVEKEFWGFFKREQATSLAGVPYTYGMLKRLRFTTMDLPSLKTMTQAGGRLAPELHRELVEHARATGRRFFVMYGQTEATARMAYLPPDRSLEKCGSIGIAIPGGELFLRDGDGSTITQHDVTGELVYRGPNVTLGYAHSSDDLAKGDDNGRELATGDMAKRDADGHFYIVGRKKRFIKIFGNRVNLDEIEQLIQSAFPGSDCACVGRDDLVTIFVVDGHAAADVRRFISGKTGLNLTAFQVTTIPAIPKSTAGKTLYAQLETSLA
jgi:acyl-CoA synthetase (AMP-forming)/AMP-acid ligase II